MTGPVLPLNTLAFLCVAASSMANAGPPEPLSFAVTTTSSLPPVGAANAEQSRGATKTPAGSAARRGRFELKRQNTSRGTAEESTKTTLRVENFFAASINLLRLDLPFPDEETDFSGSPFEPRLGDIKIRVGFRAMQADGYTFPSFIEMTFPTADPESLGSGKYQLSAGIRMVIPVTLPVADPASHAARTEFLVQQVNSIGGDEERADINYTKLELTYTDIWRATYQWKLKLKPVVDWIDDGETGAVGELEAGMFFAGDWRTWLMMGRRVWGPEGVSSTYDDRVEIGIALTY